MSAWDAIVVGGGPAGSATAARLAADGHAVLLLDRAAFPRRKPCGECVNPAGVAALRRLGALDRVLAAEPARLDGWRIAAADGRAFLGRFPSGVHGLGLGREVLDALLVDHARDAGVEVRTGAKVVDLRRDGSRVTGVVLEDGTEIASRVVVGADGLRSIVVRRLELLRRPPRLRKLALTAHVRLAEPLAGRGELRTLAAGCVGIAEVDGGRANVTVVVTGEEMHAVGGDRDAYFDRALRRCGLDAERVDEVLATGPFDWPVRRAVEDGALLVGDAAGYYDPFTGQGIFRALRGAELAADALHAALRGGDTTGAALAPYEKARRHAFGSGERLQHLVEAFVSRPRLLGWAAGRFARRPALGDAIIRATGDVRPVRSLFSPALIVRLVA